MAGVRNLRQTEAIERARLLDVAAYDISLDLSNAGSADTRTFRSVTQVRFTCAEPGASTFIELAADALRSATLNGAPLDLSGWTVENGLPLTGLAAENTLLVDADCLYSTTGQGMHRSADPSDGQTYLYSQFETNDAQRVFACFDQPDLKAEFTFTVTVPTGWLAISNMPVAERSAGVGTTTFRFEKAPKMSTYITAVCAGPYHEVREVHDGIDLGVYCRQSMKQYFDADDLLLITKQGFDFFHEKFEIRYPLPKYDQVYSPDFNAGAMENFGCIVHAEQHYIFRSPVTDFEYEQRANTILHEMAHMWFGDLVTMRWWDDLWLNESFAEWASHWCSVHATRFTDAWTTFLSIRKAWGYRQDQLSSTHPIYCEMPDIDAVEVNFDGITYAKGASVIKQLVAYVGEEAFLAGLRSYFTEHAWGNATFDDLLNALEASSGRELRKFASQWLETAQVNTLRPETTIGADGRYTSVAIRQEAPVAYPTLRTHRVAVGRYDLDETRPAGARLVRRALIDLEVSGERTAIPELVGQPAADLLLVNDEDLTYAKLRLDEISMATVVERITELDSSLPRGLCWAAAWDMVRDGELATRDYLQLVVRGLAVERDINLVTSTLSQLRSALAFYAAPSWAPEGWRQLAGTAQHALANADPGSGDQLIWARTFAAAARSSDDLDVIAGWLRGVGVPPGLRIEADLRWYFLQCLVASGGAGSDDIAREFESDRTGSGERQAALARALIADPVSKAETWHRLVEDNGLPNWLQRSLLQGFQHPAQVGLTASYASQYFAVVGQVWDSRDSEPAQEFVEAAYPSHQVSEETLAMTSEWLKQPGHPAPLRRLVTEGGDGVQRALRARARDAASG